MLELIKTQDQMEVLNPNFANSVVVFFDFTLNLLRSTEQDLDLFKLSPNYVSRIGVHLKQAAET